MKAHSVDQVEVASLCELACSVIAGLEVAQVSCRSKECLAGLSAETEPRRCFSW